MIRSPILLAAAMVLAPLSASAEGRIPSHCIALSALPEAQVVPASWTAPVARDSVAIRFIDHAMFLIRADGGSSVVTDYSGFIGATAFAPTVATMNHAHSTHWTPTPDPAIPHVLQGWGDGVEPADHRLDLGDMVVRNVATDIRSRFGDGRVERFGNSVFVVETAGLCIGHLGHLHHEPDADQYAAIGRLDVVMAPVDGGLTLPHETLLAAMERFRSSVVIPMHWFGQASLDRFVARMEGAGFDVVRVGGPDIVLSLDRLPSRPTVMVLEPEFLSD
ncbi:MAG: MBL fold metallo-hydrolase [Rhodobacteraceae bacterium]|jgi:L-ascorbate metabolism protein UlaG (beta-lactamase superfamily)|nr:MBL fold metallo-hydrolase [Paracoccaceae bacterium]